MNNFNFIHYCDTVLGQCDSYSPRADAYLVRLAALLLNNTLTSQSEAKYDQIEEGKTYICPVAGCIHQESHVLNMQSHIFHHCGMSAFRCQAEGCNFATTDKHELHRHGHQVHTDYNHRPFACSHPGCSYRSTQKCNLKAHEGRMHKQYDINE
jgi:uncharacterized Zn-finger protein